MNMKRMRGRGGHRQGGPGGGGGGGGGGGPFRPATTNTHQPMNRNHTFDSNGPDMRLRGTAQQLFEKYLQLGRDATGGGDRVMAESYFQHAEHYFRILNAMAQATQQQPGQQQSGQQPRRQQNGPESMDSSDQQNEGEGQQPQGHYAQDQQDGPDAEQHEVVQ